MRARESVYAQLTARYWIRGAIRTALGAEGYLEWDGRRRERHYMRAGVIFIHIPKAAGSSISEALYGTRLGHPTAEHLARYAPAAWESLPVFAVVRDPFARLASAYRYVVSGGTKEGAVRFRWVYRSRSFRTFSSFVKDWLSRVDLLAQDIVFWPQSHFLLRAGQLEPRVDLAALEDSHRLSALLERFGVAQLPVRNRSRSGRPYSYDPEMEEVVHRIYGSDLALYGRIRPERSP